MKKIASLLLVGASLLSSGGDESASVEGDANL